MVVKVRQYPRNADGTPMDLEVAVLTDPSGNNGARLVNPPIGPDNSPIDAKALVVVDPTGALVVNASQISDEPYGPVWDGTSNTATRNAIYDKINAIDIALEGKADDADLSTGLAGKANLAGGNALTGQQSITATGVPLTIDQGNQTNVNALLITNNGIGYTGAQINYASGGAYRIGSLGGGLSVEHYVENREMFFWTNGGAYDTAPTSFQFATSSGTAKHAMSIKRAQPAHTGDFLRFVDNGDIVLSKVRNDGNIQVPTDPYNALWNNNLDVPTKKALYDKIEALGSASGVVSDEAYGATWNGVVGVAPSKNAVYDQIQALVLGGGSFLPLTGGILTGGLHINSAVPQLILRSTAGNPTLRFRDTADNNTLADFFVTSGAVNLKAGVNGLQIMNAAGTTTYYILAQSGLTVNTAANITGAVGIGGNVVISKVDPAITLAGSGNATITSGALPMNHVAASHWFYAGPGNVKLVVSDTYVDAQVFAVHMGKQDGGVASDFNVLFKNTSVYSTINLTSTVADGTGGQTDGYIQSKRNGPLTVSGITGLDFRVASTQIAWVNAFGMGATGSIQAKSSTPATHGYVGLMPGNVNNSGYIEFYAPDQLRSGYVGFTTAGQMNIAADGGRKIVNVAASHEWQRTPDAVVLATLSGAGGFETFSVAAKGSTGTFAAANQVQAIEARSASSGDGAFMAFHTPGLRAMHIGLDVDNQFKIGGWGWTGAKFRFMDTGNFYAAGNIIQMESSAQCEIQFGPGAAHGIHYMSSTNSGFYKAGGNHFYCEMNSGGFMNWSGLIKSAGALNYRHYDGSFGSANIRIDAGAPSGMSDGDIWLQYV